MRRHHQKFHPEVANPHLPRPILFSKEDQALLITTDYKCDECRDVSFSTFKEWVLHHRNTHNRDMGYKDVDTQDELKPINTLYRPCPLCGLKRKGNAQMVAHIKFVHFQVQEHVCTICSKFFPTKFSLKTHIEIVHSEAGFLCLICGAAFHTKRKCDQPVSLRT